MDPTKSQPFAQLTIVIDKAQGLTSPDFNGLADPYVTLSLNGSETNIQRSATVKRTLAPHWNETFVVDVYHPISILTVTVFDEEYGDGDMAEIMGLEDVLAGWVDVRTGAMPMNEWISGWFELANPKHYKDTITGRLETTEEFLGGVGRVHLKMRLSTTHARAELFAMCLPLPDLGHSCHLDLADLVHDVVSLSKAMDKINVEIWGDVEWALHHATPIYALAMMVIWYPATAFPVSSILTPLLLVYISSQFFDTDKEVPHGLGGGLRKDKKANAGNPTPKPPGSQSCLPCVEAKSPTTSPELTDKIPKVDNMSPEKKAHQAAMKQAADTENTLKNLVHLLPKHAAKELRKSAADMERLVELIEGIETLSALRAGLGTKFLVIAALVGGIPSAIGLYIFAGYQEFMVQVVLTCLVSYYLWQYSCPGRLCTGIFYFILAHWRIRARYLHAHNDHHDDVQVRTLARAHIKHLGLKAKGRLHDDHINLHGHHFDLTTFQKTTWCDDCGQFLWGVSDQGFHCKGCGQNVCSECAHSDGDGVECVGACQEHDLALTTFRHATWCSQCDDFLWGVRDQGFRCTTCSQVECHRCQKKRCINGINV